MHHWRGAHLAGPLALVIIFAAFLALGANTATLAAYFSTALLSLLVLVLLVAPAPLIMEIGAKNWITFAAALAFVGVAILTVLPPQPALAWLSASTVSFGVRGPASLAPFRTIEGIAAFGAPVAAFALGALCAPTREARQWLAQWLFALTLAFALWGLVTFQGGPSTRLDARLGSANAAATVFGSLALFSCAYLVRASRRKLGSRAASMLTRVAMAASTAPLAAGAGAIALLCLALTLSRGGILAAGVGMGVLTVSLALSSANGVRRQFVLAASAVGLAIAAATFVFLRRSAIIQAPLGEEISVHAREVLVSTYWRAFLERPAFGHGLNTYHDLSSLAGSPQTWEALRTSGSVHNVYVQSLAETGIVGLGLLTLAIAPPLLAAIRNVLRAQGAEWSAGVLAVAALVLTHGLVDFDLQVPAIAALIAFMTGAFVRRFGHHGSEEI